MFCLSKSRNIVATGRYIMNIGLLVTLSDLGNMCMIYTYSNMILTNEYFRCMQRCAFFLQQLWLLLVCQLQA